MTRNRDLRGEKYKYTASSRVPSRSSIIKENGPVQRQIGQEDIGGLPKLY